jgi:hypothetical protein
MDQRNLLHLLNEESLRGLSIPFPDGTYRTLDATDRIAYWSAMLIRVLPAVSIALSEQLFVGFSATSNGELSVTLLFDRDKLKVYITRTMSALEASEVIADAIAELRGAARRAR